MKKLAAIKYLLVIAALACIAAAVILLLGGHKKSAEPEDIPKEETSDETELGSGVVYSTAYYTGHPALHLSYYMADNQQNDPVYADGSTLYTRLKFTGSALPEEQIYNIRELESLFEFNDRLGLFLEERGGDGTEDVYTGMHLLKLVRLAGLPDDAPDDCTVTFCADGREVFSLTVEEAENAGRIPLIVFGKNGYPLVENKNSPGYDSEADNRFGPVAVLVERQGKQALITGVTEILVSLPYEPEDPHYGFHNRDPYLEMAQFELTTEIMYSDGTESKAVFTAETLERLAAEHREAVSGGYYATNGNLDSLAKYGDIGGFIDYYEGLRLSWFFENELGIKCGDEYSADFFDRNGDWIATVDDISYFWGKDGAFDDYYAISRDNCVIRNEVPILGISKNGYPQLWEHDHETAGAVRYNLLNSKLYALGFETEVGVVQNVTGPFTACLPNCDGSYGGYQITTGGSCSIIKIYPKG
ncbi:MAG: hypothetical protein HUJ65_00920 [Oscillospiraceae bacterium]|nr:hypothetical protein [Oscillospiraceae bacterium]